MKQDLFISVIIPAYNVENYISRTLDSLANQTCQSFEIVIINDGSTDSTLTVIDDYISASDMSITLLNQRNGGVSAARNAGITKANGEYILFLDGDDLLKPDFVYQMSKSALGEKNDLLFCRYEKLYEDGTFEKVNVSASTICQGQCNLMQIMNCFLKNNMFMWTGAVIYKKEFLDKYNIRFSKGVAYSEDQEFTIKAIYHAQNIFFINRSIVYYRQRNSSVCNSINVHKIRAKYMAFYKLKRYFEAINDEKMVSIISSFKIPQNIAGVLTILAKKQLKNDYERLLSKKVLKKYLSKVIYNFYRHPLLAFKIVLVLFFSDAYFSIVEKKAKSNAQR